MTAQRWTTTLGGDARASLEAEARRRGVRPAAVMRDLIERHLPRVRRVAVVIRWLTRDVALEVDVEPAGVVRPVRVLYGAESHVLPLLERTHRVEIEQAARKEVGDARHGG